MGMHLVWDLLPLSTFLCAGSYFSEHGDESAPNKTFLRGIFLKLFSIHEALLTCHDLHHRVVPQPVCLDSAFISPDLIKQVETLYLLILVP